MNKKIIAIITVVILIIILLTGSTFAYLRWASVNNQRTNVTFSGSGKGFSCTATGGGNITENEVKLAPSLCTNQNSAIKRTITAQIVNNRDISIYMDLWLEVKSISQGLSNSQNFKYALSTSETSCSDDNVVTSGTFYGKTANSKIPLISGLQKFPGITRPPYVYYLYIWLDAAEEDDTTQDQSFHFELSGRCTDEHSTPNAPEIVDGLIPVKISNSGDTVKSVNHEIDTDWYNYDNKKWANAVLIKEDTHPRSYYLETSGRTIPQEDILAYFVWIPRYSYKVWQYSGSSPLNTEREIEVKFVDNSTIEVPSQTGEWYTHPAFWWDDDSDGVRDEGEELAGIWVGKFETSHTTLTSSTTYNNLEIDYYQGQRILPNVHSLRYNNVRTIFEAVRGMEGNDNAYGIDPANVDTHLIKNSEWGAVAYLSHSKYGINGEVRINNQNAYITGCGAITPEAPNEDKCTNPYGYMTIYPQSTTGNVSGVFDMAGGSYEYVMGNYNGAYGTNSGYNATYTLPDSKYYNNYPQTVFNGTDITNFIFCTLDTCGGHALSETKGWYNGTAGFVTNSAPWFLRGGDAYSYNEGNIFSVSNEVGKAWNSYSFRPVLIKNIDTEYVAPK